MCERPSSSISHKLFPIKPQTMCIRAVWQMVCERMSSWNPHERFLSPWRCVLFLKYERWYGMFDKLKSPQIDSGSRRGSNLQSSDKWWDFPTIELSILDSEDYWCGLTWLRTYEFSNQQPWFNNEYKNNKAINKATSSFRLWLLKRSVRKKLWLIWQNLFCKRLQTFLTLNSCYVKIWLSNSCVRTVLIGSGSRGYWGHSA